MSWNVNGLRSVLKKNFLDFLDTERPDLLSLQEVKVGPNAVEQLWPAHYATFWSTARRPGYSGTALFCRTRPQRENGLGIDEHDLEGRLITAEFSDFFLVNVYAPNSRRGLERLPYRRTWNRCFREHVCRLAERKTPAHPLPVQREPA